MGYIDLEDCSISLMADLSKLGAGLELVTTDREYVNSLINYLKMMIKKSNDNKKKGRTNGKG